MPRVLCPSCGKAGTVPEGIKARIKCPACGERFDAPLKESGLGRTAAEDETPRPLPPGPPVATARPAPAAVHKAADPEIAEGEPTLYQASPSMFRNRPILFLILVGLPILPFFSDGEVNRASAALGGILISGPWLAIWYLRCRVTTLTITDRRIVLRRGILSRDTNEVMIRDVRNVRTRQGLFQRLFAVGFLGVSTSGQADVEIQVSGIPNPQKAKEIINQNRP